MTGGNSGWAPEVAGTAARGTAIGASAVLMWSLLAPLTAAANGIPPFQLLSMTFATAFVVSMMWLIAASGLRQVWSMMRQPLGAWLLSIGGLFGYHALYFVALDRAPPAEASLIAYLWPLLIVLLSSLLGKQPLHPAQVVGAVFGFIGTAILVLQGTTSSSRDPLGYLAAFGCAVVWSGYSVLNRRYRHVPSSAIAVVCGVVAVMGGLTHALFEAGTVMPDSPQWLAIISLGIGPVGLAFLAWDYGTKRGHLALLGVLSYGAPVLSTLLLVALGQAEASLGLFTACVLVVAGALLASLPQRSRAMTTQVAERT